MNFDKVDPIFNIDEEMSELLNNIDSKINDIKITDKQKRKYMVTKSKVRSIHSSLAIEANSLSLFDVENILEHKQIIGKRDEIQEVKNAIEAYNGINNIQIEYKIRLLIGILIKGIAVKFIKKYMIKFKKSIKAIN